MNIKEKIIEEFKDEYAKQTNTGRYAKKGTEDYYAQLEITKWDRLLIDITINTMLSLLKTTPRKKRG